MKFNKKISILIFFIIGFSMIATLSGVLSTHGPGEYEYTSIRGENVTIYGKGFYQHMSADVAIQGIAQDYVTLLIGIPLLIIGLYLARKNKLKGQILLSGTLGYFTVTYLFYLCMAMYNPLFLLWIILASLSFYTFLLSIFSIGLSDLTPYFKNKLPTRFIGGFLIFNAILIGIMWLGVILPPFLNGRIYPTELEHYTTLIVQGLDLSILLPASFLSGFFILKKKTIGFMIAPIYTVFLSLLMTALSAKIIAMSFVGANVIPAIILIPLITSIAIISVILILKNINEQKYVY